MVSFLSMPDDVIKLVGKRIIGSRHAGLREWCRVTSTCKRLWTMQLPDAAFAWSVESKTGMIGKSKMTFCSHTHHLVGKVLGRAPLQMCTVAVFLP